MNISTAIIVQARTGSTRLPNKMLLPFSKNENLLEVVIAQIAKAIDKNKIIIATSEALPDDEIEKIAIKNEVNCFRGSENDVLKRFIDAAKHYDINNVIRVCADNPFISPNHIQSLIREIEAHQVDYLSYSYNDGTPTIKSHIGLFAEAVTISALIRVSSLTTEKIYHEHVTNFIYEHPERFDLKFLPVPVIVENNKHIRLTIDTKEDFLNVQKLYERIDESYSVETLIDTINKDSAMLKSMENQIQKNTK